MKLLLLSFGYLGLVGLVIWAIYKWTQPFEPIVPPLKRPVFSKDRAQAWDHDQWKDVP